ncbi:MAG: flagellar export chaperone FlgN [Candidatus Hydrogenedentota bacterium]
MDKLLDRLCGILDAELVRQETILSICRKKRDAIRAVDIEALEARTAALEAVLQESIEAEAERHRTLRLVVQQLGLSEEGETLTGLIEAAPEPWKARLLHFQRKLKETLRATQTVTHAYARELRYHLQLCGQHFVRLGLDSQESKAGLYGPKGSRPERMGASSALVNQRG